MFIPANSASGVSYNEKKNSPALIFSVTVILFTVIYWLTMFLTHSKNIGAYFLTDHYDTYMDYFNMLSNIAHEDPYYAYANYPALCFVFWKIMYRFLPVGDPEWYGIGYNLRTNMIAELGYFLFVGVCLVAIWEFIQYFVKGSKAQKVLFGVSFAFSGPVFFMLERGNILIAVLVFLLAFLALYDSDKFSNRVLAYVFLSLAAAIKIYPAVFGLLVLNKKRFKETIMLVVMGISYFVLPFFVFDGFDSMLTMVKGFFVSTGIQVGTGWGHSFSFDNLVRLCFGCFGINLTSTPGWLMLIPVVLCVILFFVAKKEWQKLFALVLVCIWTPTFSYTYSLTLFIIPVISLFFCNKEKFGAADWICSVLFALLFIPYNLPLIDKVNIATGLDYTRIGPDGLRYPVSWGSIILNGAIVILFALIFIYSICDRLCKKNNCEF